VHRIRSLALVADRLQKAREGLNVSALQAAQEGTRAWWCVFIARSAHV
jgi:hypothetical protein